MTSDAFKQGMSLLEGALQGDFLPNFLTLLEGRLKDIPDDTWGDVIEYLMRSTRKPRELTYNDFLRAWTDVRVEAAQCRKRAEASEFTRSAIPDPRPLNVIFAELNLGSMNPWAASIVKELETHVKKKNGTLTNDDRVNGLREKYPDRYQEALNRVGRSQPEPESSPSPCSSLSPANPQPSQAAPDPDLPEY